MSDAPSWQMGGGQRFFLTLASVLATTLMSIDLMIASVALPQMQGSLSATSDQISWVLTSYVIALAVMTPVVGPVAARVGRRPAFLVARRLVDQDGQAAEFGADLLRRKEVQPRGQDRRFQDRVFGTVEPKKVADSALGDDMAGDRRPRRAIVQRQDAKLVPAAGVSDHNAFHFFGFRQSWQRIQLMHGRPRQHLDVVRHVQHALPCTFQVGIRAGGLVRAEHKLAHLRVDQRAHRRDIGCAVGVDRGHERFENHGAVPVPAIHYPFPAALREQFLRSAAGTWPGARSRGR